MSGLQSRSYRTRHIGFPPSFFPHYFGISFHSDWEGEGGRVALWKFLPSDGLWLLLCQGPLLVLSASMALSDAGFGSGCLLCVLLGCVQWEARRDRADPHV